MNIDKSRIAPPPGGMDFFEHRLCQQLVQLRLRAAEGHPFTAKIGANRIGELLVADVASGGFRVLHGRSEIARSRVPFTFACVHISGTASIRRGGEERALSPGDVFLLDTQNEFELGCERAFHHLILRLPKEWVDARLVRPDLVSGTIIGRERPLSRFFSNYLVNGFETADQLSDSTAALFAQHSVELLAEALGEARAGPPEPSQARRAAMFARGCRLIRLKIGDPNLRPDQIARALGITRRTLERLFAEQDDSIMGRVQQERIHRAASLLAAPAAAHRSITEIAFACGFSDSSHFGRVFAARMNMPPSQWRKQKIG